MNLDEMSDTELLRELYLRTTALARMSGDELMKGIDRRVKVEQAVFERMISARPRA